MMEEDDEESNILGATRYPCMPSLVALQQMRNRLHLAYLGKKLMKWTALATGRELRKIAEDMTGVYGDFSEDIRTGYILLARCRYFYPSLNKMVVENGPMKAGVVVTTTTKSISGVKCINFEIIETGVDGYQHLGIDKGGETVKRAKEVWLDLLKRMIHILQLRQSFEQVETAHRSATKKMNVLAKVIVPKCKMSIRYILDELEELEREEFFRLKKILEVKYKHKSKITQKETQKEIDIEEKVSAEKTKCLSCGEHLNTDNEDSEDEKLQEYKAQLAQMLAMTKQAEKDGVITTDTQEFLKTAEELQKGLEEKKVASPKPVASDVALDQLCPTCQDRVNEERATKAKEVVEEKEEPPPEPQYQPQIVTECPADLGSYEIDVNEITKIVRVRNEDGTITEEKKVIVIKKEVRNVDRSELSRIETRDDIYDSSVLYQASNTSTKSSPFTDKKTVGAVAIRHLDDTLMKPTSLTQRNTNPKAHYCISIDTMMNIDNNCKEINFGCESLKDLLNFNSNVSLIFDNYKHDSSIDYKASTSIMDANEQTGSKLTNSETQLIYSLDASIQEQDRLKSKSVVIASLQEHVKIPDSSSYTVTYNKKND